MTMNRMDCGLNSEFSQVNFRALAEHHALGNESENTPEKRRRMNLAILEAEALACQTGLPHLLLLTLAEEKVSAVRQWYARQRALTQRSLEWTPEA